MSTSTCMAAFVANWMPFAMFGAPSSALGALAVSQSSSLDSQCQALATDGYCTESTRTARVFLSQALLVGANPSSSSAEPFPRASSLCLFHSSRAS